MDCSRKNNNRRQRCGYSSSIAGHDYDVVDVQEEARSVLIHPARPMNEGGEYADRDLLRSSFAGSPSSLCPGKVRFPPRDVHYNTGPAINRDLKPGRRKAERDKWLFNAQPGDQLNKPAHRRSPSPPASALESVNPVPVLTQHIPRRRERHQRTTANAGFTSRALGLQSEEATSGPRTNHRHSLELDTQDIEIRRNQNPERVPSKRHHHEWPQTKGDFDQHDFVPKDKPQQTYCEEDWYVGACDRADAEHALHLVNKDGAFLVRDCSINTDSNPLVLAVYHEKKVYNVKIRFMEGIGKYVLGTGPRSRDLFDSVADIIKFHAIFPIILISGRNVPRSKYPENCVLTWAVTRRDVDQLLR